MLRKRRKRRKRSKSLRRGKKFDHKFQPIPETTYFTKEQLDTENAKVLDPIEISDIKRPKYSYGKRMRISALYEDDSDQYLDQEVKVCGWAKTARAAGKGAFHFVELYDGSIFGSLQVVVDKCIEGYDKLETEGVGTSFSFVGTLIASPGKGQKYELQVNDNEKHTMTIYGS
jgi:hypothetical protein